MNTIIKMLSNMKKKLRHEIVESIREIIFGLEDSLVSTLGAITGIAVGAQSTYIVILSGLVLIAAEGMSMAAGSYLSSKSAEDAQAVFHKTKGIREHTHPIRSAFVMGAFYFSGGFIPLAPYFFLSVDDALAPSILITAIALFGVGVWAAYFTKRSKLKSGFEMAGVSLAAALVGYLIGRAVATYFGVDVL
jgi:predicted membrane protein (TIGR00267 family)